MKSASKEFARYVSRRPVMDPTPYSRLMVFLGIGIVMIYLGLEEMFGGFCIGYQDCLPQNSGLGLGVAILGLGCLAIGIALVIRERREQTRS